MISKVVLSGSSNNLTHFVCGAGVCSTRGKVYCIGGWNGYSGIKQCDVYDPNTNAWTTIASLHSGEMAVGSYKGHIERE